MLDRLGLDPDTLDALRAAALFDNIRRVDRINHGKPADDGKDWFRRQQLGRIYARKVESN